ncbi:hypothetical protein [Corynebacterium alimapuense]|uniref:Uncharacterized protein n=1 Tax=Corynebacterium alimapuense TaxID=1576874 RepID=A0A3M8K6E6_9CORY|nr:hypothetical protein [Corynebacterium alimapuense]RNE48736.1 hypothetical protein C5L39_05340 [Corynebacterium alimapuense]
MTPVNSRPLPPTKVRWAGVIAICQSLIGLGYAGILIVREFQGKEDPSLVSEGANIAWVGFGTAIFFIIIFGAVLAGAVSMMKGRKWGRGPVAMMEMILLLISYYMFSGGALWAALATAASALAALIFLFSPKSVDWAAENYRS